MYWKRTKANEIEGIDLDKVASKLRFLRKETARPKKQVIYKSLPHQKKVVTSKKKNIFMGGGVGCGKTDIGAIWSRMKMQHTPKDVIGIIAANSYSQLIDSTLRNIYKKYKEWGIPVFPTELPRMHKPFNIKVWNGKKKHFVEVLCRSLDSYNLLSGVEVGWIWVDECWMTKKEAIDILAARLRDKRMLPYEVGGKNSEKEVIPGLQMLYTTTLDEPDTWMYELFVDNFVEEEMDVFYATTYDNEHNLGEGYIDTLKRVFTTPMFKRMVLSQWVSAATTTIYYAFDRNVHEDISAEFDPTLPVIWTHDFNIGEGKPMSSALGQVKKGKVFTGVDKRGERQYLIRSEVHWFDEIVIDSADTNEAILEFKSRPWFDEIKRRNLPVLIHGDAAGNSRDTRSKTTDYELLAEAGFDNQLQPAANPRIRDRHNATNAMLTNAEGDVRTKIHPRCKTLLKGLETVHLKKGALYVEEQTRSQHITTAVGYYYAEAFPIVKPDALSQGI